jgi:hypothetical protein
MQELPRMNLIREKRLNSNYVKGGGERDPPCEQHTGCTRICRMRLGRAGPSRSMSDWRRLPAIRAGGSNTAAGSEKKECQVVSLGAYTNSETRCLKEVEPPAPCCPKVIQQPLSDATQKRPRACADSSSTVDCRSAAGDSGDSMHKSNYVLLKWNISHVHYPLSPRLVAIG